MKEQNKGNKNDKANKLNQIDEVQESIDVQDMEAFDMGLNKAVKKAKRRALIRNILISGIVVVLLFITSFYGGHALNNSERFGIESTINTLYEIAKPNQYLGQSMRFEGIANGYQTYTTYKWLDETLVYTGEHTYHYGFPQARWTGTFSPSILGTTYDDTKQYPSFNALGQREMIFYYPYVEYTTVPYDLDLLADIPQHKVVELALSFDDVYSLEELEQFIPQNNKIVWYWLDDIGEDQKDTLMSEDELGKMNRVRSEDTAFGIKTRNSHGEPINEPFEWFMLILENSYNDLERMNSKTYETIRLKANIENLYNQFLKNNPEKDINKLPIAGIVVTGDVESLEVWQNVEQVRAVSLGTTADRY